MELTLLIDGKKKTFVSGTIYLGSLTKLIEMQTRINFTVLDKKEDFDEFINFICEDIFQKQFTPAQLKAGLTVSEWNEKYLDFFKTVNGVLPKSEKKPAKN